MTQSSIDNSSFYKKNDKYSTFLSRQNFGVFQKYADKIIEHGKENDGFLDVGCGVGHTLELLKNSSLKTQGIDISEPSIEICQKAGHACSKYDGKEFPFVDQQFEVVGSYNVIEHVDDVPLFLDEMYRVLKLDGYLVIACPNFLSLTNSYHWHTRGFFRKVSNLIEIFSLLLFKQRKIAKMNTITRDVYQSDDDACNVTNPVQLIMWAKDKNMKLVYWSSQSVYKQGLIARLDFYPLQLFLGSSFLIFKK